MNAHAVASHFPHDFSAKLTFRGGADEQAAETARVTCLKDLWPSPFFPIEMKPLLIFHALNVDPALGNRQGSILGRVNRELVEDQSERRDVVCADRKIYPHDVGAFLAPGVCEGQEDCLKQSMQSRGLGACEWSLVRWPR